MNVTEKVLKEAKINAQIAERHLRTTKSLVRTAKLTPVGILLGIPATVLLWDNKVVTSFLLTGVICLALMYPFLLYNLLVKPYKWLWAAGPERNSYRLNIAIADYDTALSKYQEALDQFITKE